MSNQDSSDYRYWAFISYSGRDKSWGRWLHRAIETYGIPAELVARHQTPIGHPAPKRFHPLFRDRDELPASANLGAEIGKALRASRYLIVVCSPHSASSQWVNKEIETFLAFGRRDHILAIIVDGEPNAGGERECFPPTLRAIFEPIAADARSQGDGKTNAKLKLLAGMLGVSFDSLKQRDARRRIRYLQKVIVLSMLIAFSMAGLAAYAYFQRNKAVKARKSAEHNLAYMQLAQAGMLTDDGRMMEAKSLYMNCLDKLQKLGEPIFPVTVGLSELHALSPPALLTFRGHTGGVCSVAFSHNGEFALSGSADKTMKLWEVKTGREIRSYSHQAIVNSVGFSPDGQWALSGSIDGTLKIFEINSGKEIRSFCRRPAFSAGKVAFTPDGAYIVGGETLSSSNLSINVWSTDTGGLVRTFGWDEDRMDLLETAISADGKYVLSAANQHESRMGNTVILWDLATGKDLRHFKGHNAFCAAFSPDGQYAASGGFDKKLVLWEIATGKAIRTFEGHRNPVNGVTFSPDGKRLLSTAQDRSVRLWDLATGLEVRAFLGHTSDPWGVAYSPDGRWALSAGMDQTLKLWEIEPYQEIRPFVGQGARVGGVAFSPDGRFALSSGGNGTVLVWDIATGLVIQRFPFPRVRYTVPSADGKLALSLAHKELRLWSIETGAVIRSISNKFSKGFCQVAISPDGRRAISGCYTPVGELTLWDLTTGETVGQLTNGNVTSTGGIAFLPDGKRAISIDHESMLTLWDLNTGQVIWSFQGHIFRAECVAVSPDGAYALSGGWDRKIRLWEIATGLEIRTFIGHEGNVVSVVFSPDGQWALSRSDDSTVRLWNVQSGEEVRTLSWKEERPQSVSFSPDGKSALIGSEDGIVRHWDFSRAEQHRNYECLVEEAQSQLTKDDNNAGALKVLGEYYAFRGKNDWAVDMLERARKGGVQVSPLTLARCYWLLSEEKTIGQPDRLRHRSAAAGEFQKELAQLKARPASEGAKSKLAREQEELYLVLCLQAVLKMEQAGKTAEAE